MRYLIMLFALQCALIPKVIAEEAIGRLFFTPQQRQYLERLRVDRQHHPKAIAADAEQEVSSLPIPLEIKTQGYVKRSDGKKSTWWVNGKPLQDEANHAID